MYSIINKLIKAWEEITLVTQGKSSKHVKSKVTSKLNKLLDILNCICVIQLCSKNSCSSNCMENTHINCSCLKETKIIKTELIYIYYQRHKTGSLSCFQIGPPDIQEHNKLKAKAHRKQRAIKREKTLFQEEPTTSTVNVLLEKSSTKEDSSVGSCCE